MQVSGKLVILAILSFAFAAAGASWWFRYAATHRAAEFWGPETAKLIRDAPVVTLLKNLDGDEPNHTGATRLERHNVSQARGLTHLRNALLEDRSFVWPSTNELPPGDWQWILEFRDVEAGAQATIAFFSNCRIAMKSASGKDSTLVISTQPIADGLATIFTELSQTKDPER